jgi:AraC-like DNA-binding protein
MPGELSRLINLDPGHAAATWWHPPRPAGLHLVLGWQGSTDWNVDDQLVTLPAGGLLFLPHGSAFRLLRQTPVTQVILGFFSRRFLHWFCRSPWSRQLVEPASRPLRVRISGKLAGELRGLAMRSALARHPDEVRLADEVQFLARAWQAWHAAGSARDPDILHPAVRETLAALDRDPVALDLRANARRLGISYGRLALLMKRQTGLTLTTQRSQARIRALLPRLRACWRWRLSEMADQMGFGSYSQFHRSFRQVTGMAPADWLRSYRQGITEAE